MTSDNLEVLIAQSQTASPLPDCETLGKSFNPSELQFLNAQSER